MLLDEAEIITHKWQKLLVFPEAEDKNPNLLYINLSYVPPELYEEIYKRYIDKKYSDND